MKLKITNVKSWGDAKEEAVWLAVLEDCTLSDYMIADTTFDDDGASNLNRHTYWFPSRAAKKGDRIVLYTGRGTNGQGKTTTEKPLHRFFWNLDVAVWNDQGDGAVLVQIASAAKFAVKPASTPS